MHRSTDLWSRVGSGIALVVGASFFASALRADVTLPAVIGDHMVLQCEKPARIFGTADAGEKIRVVVDGDAASAVETEAGPEGRFSVELAARAPGGPHEITVAGKNEIVLNDVWFGEV